MNIDRRAFFAVSAVSVLGRTGIPDFSEGVGAEMYGVIGKIVAEEGRREELAGILMEGVGGMPGCLSYVVALDTEDAKALWVTEVWDSQASHQESLSLPSVQNAIEKGRPLIEDFAERWVTTPVGGHGF